MQSTTDKQLEQLAKLQREDHDVTIRLDAKFDAFTQESRQNQSSVKDSISEVKKSIGDLAKTVGKHDEAIEALKAEDKARKDINVDRSNRRHDLNLVAVTVGTLLMAFAGVMTLLMTTGVVK